MQGIVRCHFLHVELVVDQQVLREVSDVLWEVKSVGDDVFLYGLYLLSASELADDALDLVVENVEHHQETAGNDEEVPYFGVRGKFLVL